MKIGVNVTSANSLTLIQSLNHDGAIDFCEILIDNFLHHPPEEIRQCIGDLPLSFHIMWSRFLESDREELARFGEKIRFLMKELQPIYVSDHVAQFSHQGRLLSRLAEVDYKAHFSFAKDRIQLWQGILQTKIYLENFPSVLESGNEQIEFFDRVTKQTGCGLLFDVSNAVIAEINAGISATKWLPLTQKLCHLHIGGFRHSDTEPALVIDTHDSPLSPLALSFLEKTANVCSADLGTIVVEKDANLSYDTWKQDIDKVKGIFHEPNNFLFS